jgi:hypothetical protein
MREKRINIFNIWQSVGNREYIRRGKHWFRIDKIERYIALIVIAGNILLISYLLTLI